MAKPDEQFNEQEERDERQPFANLPRFGGNREVIHLFVCEGCQASSPYTRSYSLVTIIFLLVFIVWRVDTVMKCPRCMRRHILVRLPLAIVLANVFSPVVILQWLVTFVRTFFSRPF